MNFRSLYITYISTSIFRYSELHNRILQRPKRNHALTHPVKSRNIPRDTSLECYSSSFVRIIAQREGSDLELCAPRDDDARKDARGHPRREGKVFFVAIGKVCRRKVNVYSPRSEHELFAASSFLASPRRNRSIIIFKEFNADKYD